MNKYCTICYELYKKGEYQIIGTGIENLGSLKFHPRCIFRNIGDGFGNA